MNYRDYYKKEAMLAKLKDAPQKEYDPEELKMGTEHEKEHTQDVAAAEVIAKQHLADDPHYYSKMKKAGIHECGLDDNGGLPKLGGALAVPHVGQPIHMSKIIQVGPAVGVGPATGELSGFTAIGKKGVAADKGGVAASMAGDKEPITAGGHKSDPSIATKSVGGPVVPGEGQKQGGPNTKGTYAATTKMNNISELGQDVSISLQENHKKAIRGVIKEVLKEITFNKTTGKWERITENRFASMEPDRDWGHFSGDRKDFVPPVKGTSDPEKDPVDRGGDFGEEPGELPVGEDVNMRMGPSYKVGSRQYRTSDDDQARQVEYEPEITERYDKEEESQLQERYFKLLTKQNLLTEGELEEMKRIKHSLERLDEAKKKWLKKAIDPAHKGYCTPMTKKTCTPRRKAFAMRAKRGEFSKDESAKINEAPKDVGYDYATGEKLGGGAPINIDVSKLEDVEVDGVDMHDYPDFVDAYVSSATYNGRELSDEELDWLNDEHPEIAQQAAHEHTQGAADAAYDAARDRAMGLEETDSLPPEEDPGLPDLQKAMKDVENMPKGKRGAHLQAAGARELEKLRGPSQKPDVDDLEETSKEQNEAAPSGWEGTVKAMKKHKDIDNPWALAHWMKGKGMKSHKESVEEAGGGAVQHRSYRTVKDAPQEPENRHRGDIDEGMPYHDDVDPGGFVSDALKKLFQTHKRSIDIDEIEKVGMGLIKDVDVASDYAVELAMNMANDYDYVYDDSKSQFIYHPGALKLGALEETEKMSGVQKAIRKGSKSKTTSQKQTLAYKEPKKTKSGIEKKRDE